MKNVIQSVWSGFDTVIQTELGVDIGKGRVCHYPEGNWRGAKVEKGEVSEVMYWTLVFLVFLCFRDKNFLVLDFFKFLVIWSS